MSKTERRIKENAAHQQQQKFLLAALKWKRDREALLSAAKSCADAAKYAFEHGPTKDDVGGIEDELRAAIQLAEQENK